MRLSVINGLRGIAILGVYLVHTFAGHAKPYSLTVSAFAGTGWYGVYLFFALSGFVLYLPFADGHQLDIRRFYLQRAARIYPLYLIAAFAGIIVYGDYGATNPQLWAAFAKAFTTVSYWVDSGSAPKGNGALWSLAVEIYLSIALPGLILLIRRFSVAHVAIAAFLISAVTQAMFPIFGVSAYSPRAFVVVQAFSDFCIGMLLADMYRSGRLHDLIKFPRISFIVSAAGLIALLLMVTRSRSTPQASLWYIMFWPCADILLAAFIASALTLPRCALRHVLTFWPLQLCGMMCFSLYVWHLPLLGKLGQGVSINSLGDGIFFAVTSFSIVFVFSFLTYRFVEFAKSPFISILPSFSDNEGQAQAKTAPAGATS